MHLDRAEQRFASVGLADGERVDTETQRFPSIASKGTLTWVTSPVDSPLSGLSFAERARSALAASSSLAWIAGGTAGSSLFYEECGSPILLTSDAEATELLAAGAGRIAVDLHPHLGLVRLVGQFWPLADGDARRRIASIRHDHRDCPGCAELPTTRMIGLHVVTVAIRLPGERSYRPIPLDSYLVATPDPIVAAGTAMAAHLNADHGPELRSLAATLLGQPRDQLAGASIGAIDAGGFTVTVVGSTGARMITIGFPHRPTDERDLQACLRTALRVDADGPGCLGT